MSFITSSGFETIDGCLHRHDISASLEDVLKLERNRHLATLPAILPPRTKIYMPILRPVTKEVVNLWS